MHGLCYLISVSSKNTCFSWNFVWIHIEVGWGGNNQKNACNGDTARASHVGLFVRSICGIRRAICCMLEIFSESGGDSSVSREITAQRKSWFSLRGSRAFKRSVNAYSQISINEAVLLLACIVQVLTLYYNRNNSVFVAVVWLYLIALCRCSSVPIFFHWSSGEWTPYIITLDVGCVWPIGVWEYDLCL